MEKKTSDASDEIGPRRTDKVSLCILSSARVLKNTLRPILLFFILFLGGRRCYTQISGPCIHHNDGGGGGGGRSRTVARKSSAAWEMCDVHFWFIIGPRDGEIEEEKTKLLK